MYREGVEVVEECLLQERVRKVDEFGFGRNPYRVYGVGGPEGTGDCLR